MELHNAHLAYFDHPLGRDLSLRSGRIVLLLGDSGCGKTSLLKAIAGFTDLAIGDISRNERVAMLLQNPFHQIIMQKVRDELTFPLKNNGIGKDDADKQCRDIAAKLEISHLLDRDISSLSFGETQLVMIAATCLTPADILLMDEPTSHLDPPYIKLFYTCVRDMVKRGKTVCISSQAPDEYCFADEILIMDKGAIKAFFVRDECPGRLRDEGVMLDAEAVDQYLEALRS